MLLRTRAGQRLAESLGLAKSLRHPIVVGGTGGSGTRAVRDLLIRAGVSMGTNVNGPGDALDFEPFLGRWINPILESTETLAFRAEDLPASIRRRATREFHRRMRRYLRTIPSGQRWGWKNPRSIYILPLIHFLIPGFYFVHVVRDGRDMAVSSNQNQYRKHFSSLFHATRSEAEQVMESCTMWARTNGEVADWCERVLGNRYVRLRLEDLCKTPREVAANLLGALDLEVSRADDAVIALKTPATIERWRTLPNEISERLTSVAGDTLRRFGYE